MTCTERKSTTKYRVSLVTMRKYPESGADCSSFECHNPLVLRPIRETYTDIEEVCCEGYKNHSTTGIIIIMI
ncbi:hypothetical protein DOY81_011861 [Sarcophaga bullata]|nr:hypothetical protein DOY81_011861 [Sarcophaga bullata]